MHSRFVFATLFAYTIGWVSSQSIDPNSVPVSTRNNWCQSQITQCPLICLQEPGVNSAATEANSCDADSLAYSCTCANGLSPNASEYSLTLPYYICTQNNINCVNNCGGISTCQSACQQDHPCGAQNPTRVNTSTISTMSATSTAGGAAASTGADEPVYSGFAGSAAAAATSSASDSGSSGSTSAANTLLDIGQVYGLGVMAVGIFTGFTLLL